MVQRIERAIAEGKPVEAGLRAQFEAQTGQKVSAPAETTPAPILPFDSTDELPGKDSSSRRIIQRSIKDGPFGWFSKAALNFIQEATGEGEGVTQNARSVYLALCELASDNGTERFTASKALIAFRAGMSVRTVQRVLPDLQRAGVVSIEHNALGRGTVSAYTLLHTPSHNVSTRRQNDQTPRQPDALRLADKVKERKELKEPIAPAKPPRARNPLLDALVALDGSDPAQVTSSGYGAAGKALKEIKEVCPSVTLAEIQRRGANYRMHMPDMTISPSALARHWAKCEHPPRRTSAAAQPQLREVK